MRCPQCGAENLINSPSCANCHYQFSGIYTASSQPTSSQNVVHTPNPLLAQEESYVVTRSHRPQKNIIKVALIIIGVLILAGAGYAGWYGYDKYIANTPNKVLQKSVKAMEAVKAFTFNSQFEIRISTDNSQGADNELGSALLAGIFSDKLLRFSINITGAFDETDTNIKKTSVVTSVDLGMIGSLSLETRTIGKTFYAKIKKIPPIFGGFIDVTQFENKWLVYQAGEESELPFKVPKLEVTDNEKEQTMAIIKRDLFKVFEIRKDNGIVLLDDKKTYNYTLGFNKNETINLINNLKNVSSDKERYEEMLSDMKDEDWQKFSEFKFNIWIDKKNYLVKKVQADFDSAQLAKVDEAQKGDPEFKGTLAVAFDNYNTPSEISAPGDAVKFEDFIKDIMQGTVFQALGDAREKSRDAKRVADIKQTQTALELYYVDHNSYPVTDAPVLLGQGAYISLCDKGFASSSIGQGTCYMSSIPTNPEPGGIRYIYHGLSANEYKIFFQLEADTGGLLAGEHVATPMGLLESELSDDQDHDGLSDLGEVEHNTIIDNPDSDGDGYTDGAEIKNGYNPLGAGKLND